MPPTEIDLQKSERFGRFVASFGLEDKILANGVMPEKSLHERSAVVQGIIAEKLKNGNWQEVIQLIYDPASTARLLYSGSLLELENQIVQTAKSYPKGSLNRGQFEALAKGGRTDLLVRIVEEVPLSYQVTNEYLDNKALHGYTDLPENNNRIARILAERAKAEGKDIEAYEHFRELKDENEIEGIFARLLNNDRMPLSHYDRTNKRIETLISIISSNPEKARERAKLFIEKETEGEKIKNSPARTLLHLHKEYNPEMPENKINAIYSIVAQNSSYYDIVNSQSGKIHDEKLALMWAKKHTASDPKQAYALFCRLNYDGHETVLAAQKGILFRLENHQHHNALDYHAIARNHLLKLLEDETSAPLKVKIDIAEHLDDKRRLIEYSTHLSQIDEFLSYRLWVRGDGDLKDPKFIGIRSRLIEKQLNEDYPSAYFLDSKDAAGYEAFYSELAKIKGHTERCYNIAKDPILFQRNPALLEQARNRIFAENSIHDSYDFFNRQKDEIGIKKALELIAGQYGLTVDEASATLKNFKYE